MSESKLEPEDALMLMYSNRNPCTCDGRPMTIYDHPPECPVDIILRAIQRLDCFEAKE